MKKSAIEIEIRHLRYIIAAADAGSFRKAAVALKVQESSVSRRIRDVEDQIGASLLLRHSGGINLTMAGQRFLHHARHALDHIRDGAAEVAAIGRAEGGYLKVGLFSSLSSGFLSALFRAYDARHGSVHIDFVEGEAHEHINALRQFQVDIAFVIGLSDFGECDSAYLWSEQVLVALPEGHQLAALASLTWRDINERPATGWKNATSAQIPKQLLIAMAHPTRFERVASAFGGRRSIQLSYGCVAQK